MTMQATRPTLTSPLAQFTYDDSVVEAKPLDESDLKNPDAHTASATAVQPLTAADRKLRIINLFAVLVPIGGLVAAMMLAWGHYFSWTHLAIMGVMWFVSSLGITVGFHRLLTHKSFHTPAFVRYLFAAAGSMAFQGPVITWCGEHRRHHQHSDTEGDPHSPHMNENGSWGEGFWAMMKGAYHAHMGWLIVSRKPVQGELDRYTVDLRADKALVLADKHFLIWGIGGLLLPGVIGGLVTMTWMGALLGFLWGGLVRVLACHHITWSVNSVCHLWGTKPFVSHDESRNNPIVGVLALGEGWHNNHHAFPTSARHGLRWWEFDVSYIIIRAMALVGLAKDIKVPTQERMAGKLAKKSDQKAA